MNFNNILKFMKIKDTKLTSPLDGITLKDGVGKDLTLFSVVANILLTTQTKEPAKSYTIAFGLIKTEEAELSSEDVTHIKTVVNEAPGWTPLVLGQILDLIK